MADIEVEFLCSLCSANQADVLKADQSGVTPTLFVGYEPEAIYVWEYKDKYGKLPSLELAKKRFSSLRGVATKEPFTYYLDQLIERDLFKKLQQIMVKANAEIKSQSMGGVKSALEVLSTATDLLSDGYSEDLPWAKWSALRNYMDRQSTIGLWETPYKKLNRMIRGMRNKNLVSLCARSGMCKTWIMCVFALAFHEQGARVLFVSKEMTRDEIYERLDGLLFNIDWIRYVEGTMRLKDVKSLERRRERYFKGKPSFVVTDTEDMQANGILSVDSKISEHSPDVVLIDGAYLLDEATGKSMTEKATMISRSTKRVAKYRNVLIMQSLQMNRKAEEEEGDLQHINWSDAYGQDSDYVLYVKGDKSEPTRIIELLKGRTIAGGGMGEFYVNALFDPKLDFGEITQSSVKHIKVSTVEG